MNKKYIFPFTILIISTLIYFHQKSKAENYPLKSQDFKLLNIYNRKNDSKTYTQGLFFSEDKKSIFESGGLYKKSSIKKLEYPSLKLIKEKKINKNYFGEGIAECGKYIYQLTWREKKIIKYNKETLEIIEELEMDKKIKEGWGLSNSNNINELFATDGTDKIYRLDCNNNLKVINFINVKYNGKSINYLNDLCYADGFIYLNIYFLNQIAKVNLNGNIVKFYNLQNLVDFELKKGVLTKSKLSQGNVLNGIAYNDEKKSFLVTGKKWSFMYEIQFIK
jgi:glutamine cyclotransferase